MADIYLDWECPHCEKDIRIFVEIDSPSDYYPDLNCEHCGAEIRDDKLDDKIMEEASEYFASQAEWYKDR